MLNTPRTSFASLIALLPLTLAMAAGCGGETTDVSESVNELNRELTAFDLTADCPDEVDGGEGATFVCTLATDDGEASDQVTFRIETQNDEYVMAPADEQEFFDTLEGLTDQGEAGGGQD